MFLDGQKIYRLLVISSVILLCLIFVSGQTTAPKTKQASTEQLIAEAAEAYSSEDLNRAKLLLRKVLMAAPQNAEAHALSGIIAERENDLATAEKHLATAARLQPKSPEMRNNYGAILLRLNRNKDAAREFTASLAANPNQRSALINLAQIRFKENKLEAAQELFEKAKAIGPDAEIARALLIISLGLKDTEQTKKYFQDYFAFFKDSANQKERGEISRLLFENGLIAETIQELEAAIGFDKQNVNLLVLLARAYLREKNIKSAGRLLEAAVAGGLEEPKIYAALAEVYEAGGYFENAIPAMRRAIEKDPQNEFYRARYGLLLVDAKAPAAALIRLNEALKEFPNSGRLWLAIGIAHLNDNKTAEARNAFARALAIDSKLVPALAYLAVTFSDEARYDEALKTFERALLLDNNNALLHYLWADTLLKTTDPDQARIENSLKRAIGLDSNLPQAHSTLGRLYFRQGRLKEAANSFERSVKLEPNHAETLYQLSRVYARLKRMDESQAVLAKFKQLNESQKDRKESDRRDLVRRLANVRF